MIKNILTIDVEEYFHLEYMRGVKDVEQNYRTPENIDFVLKVLNESDVVATFFVVGEIMERFPDVCERILSGGHEIACHGYYHEPLWRSNIKKFELEIKKFDRLVKEKCLGFRAPSFSLNNETRWALKVLIDAKYRYDSSVFPARTPLYGVPDAPMRPYKPSSDDIKRESVDGKLWEFPMLVFPLMGLKIPVAGGFYLRFYPTSLIKKAIRKMNKRGFPAVIYVHNWELDSNMPRFRLGPYKSFVTYYNIKQTKRKLKSLLSTFSFSSFKNFIEEQELFL